MHESTSLFLLLSSLMQPISLDFVFLSQRQFLITLKGLLALKAYSNLRVITILEFYLVLGYRQYLYYLALWRCISVAVTFYMS